MVFLEAKLHLKLKASSRFLGSVSLRWAENGEPITDNRFLFNLQLESWNLELMTKNVDAKRRNEELGRNAPEPIFRYYRRTANR